ncbi:hypothetical protein FKM82_020192 [Ascaphus truei]
MVFARSRSILSELQDNSLGGNPVTAKMADSDYESVICVKPEVHVYRIPPRASNRGYRAAEWQLDQPAWSGRLRITARGKLAFIKLEDKNSGNRRRGSTSRGGGEQIIGA